MKLLAYTPSHTHSHLVTHVPDEASAVQDSVLVGSTLLGGLNELDHILGTVVVSSGQLQLLPYREGEREGERRERGRQMGSLDGYFEGSSVSFLCETLGG